MNRRSFFVAISASLSTGCVRRALEKAEAASSARFLARPGKASAPLAAGLHPLDLRRQRDSLFYIPKSAPPERPAPLVVYLHGATGSEQQGIKRLSPLAEEMGFLLLSPASRGGTWDAMQEGYGVDISTLDQAFAKVFAARTIDPRRIAVCGFSDGASYALGIGLANGDLFSSIMAFSPGFIPPGGTRKGLPRIFVSHGTDDSILPIESCSRRLVPELTRAGYAVTYREFEGPHTVPPEIAQASLRWFLDSTSPAP